MEVSKNAQVVKHFLALSSPQGLGRTKLVKLVYLADLESRKIMGRAITSFRYIWHHHGPWDNDFFATFEELVSQGYAQGRTINYGAGMIEKQLVDGKAVTSSLAAAETAILEFVTSRYMWVELQDLLDNVVYESPPMKKVDRGALLPMDIVDNTVSQRVGFDLEELLEAEAAVLKGEYVTAEEFFGADGVHA